MLSIGSQAAITSLQNKFQIKFIVSLAGKLVGLWLVFASQK